MRMADIRWIDKLGEHQALELLDDLRAAATCFRKEGQVELAENTELTAIRVRLAILLHHQFDVMKDELDSSSP